MTLRGRHGARRTDFGARIRIWRARINAERFAAWAMTQPIEDYRIFVLLGYLRDRAAAVDPGTPVAPS